MQAQTSTSLRWARCIKGDYDRTNSVTSMLNDLNWDTLKQQRQQANAIMFYRVVHGLVAVATAPFLIPAAVSATRGPSMKYLIPVVRERNGRNILRGRKWE